MFNIFCGIYKLDIITESHTCTTNKFISTAIKKENIYFINYNNLK